MDLSEQKEKAEKELAKHKRKLNKELRGRQTTHVRVSKHNHKRLKRAAEKDDMTMSWLVDSIVDHYFRELR